MSPINMLPCSSFGSSPEKLNEKESWLISKSVVTYCRSVLSPSVEPCPYQIKEVTCLNRSRRLLEYLVGAHHRTSIVVPGGNLTLGSLHRSRLNIASSTMLNDAQ